MAAVELTVFHVILLFWSLRTAESQVMTLSGCEPNCGGIAIPYPFGMTEACSLDKRFKINCDSISGDPTLTVNGTDLVVRHISVYSSTIYVMFPIVFENCGVKDRNTVVDLEGSPFVFSSENYFVATGGNNLALMNQHNSAIGGWVSICDENRDPWIAGCSGINCCQTRIPSNLKVFNVTMKGVDGRNGSGGEKNCRHAYLSYYGGYPSDMKDVDSVGAVLDWGIDRWLLESLVNDGLYYNLNYTSTCENMNTSINSTIQSPIVDMNTSINSTIVQCYCNPGFEGNPYLYGNCQEGTAYGSYRRKIKAKMAGLGVGVGFGALFLLIGLWWLYKVFKRKRRDKLKKKYFKRNGGPLLQEQLSSGRPRNSLQSSQFTDKSDVYSFGVVLVELLTGQKAISFTRSEEQGRSLATYFLMAMERNCLFDILDPQVVKQGKKEDVLMVASLVRSCLRLNGKERPTMKEVTMVFERIQKSENLIIQREIEYDRKEAMGAPWDATSTSTISIFGISASSSLDEKPLLDTY
ncbi:hypothetical protein DKX38_028723 [Salix brachista]|uniref:Wall-associated receptor kinase galacturonan-binding domain-containing protein n=1 Tax=Salix brachista TaxID=2182728 RepID=A0A5N5JHW6_9ROSI|nr:hypothetical protein DKX38_028723 [Salix brachista]